jgi:hypothetical protein
MTATQYLFICVVVIAMLSGIVSAIQPEYGSATIDGDPFEWVEQTGVNPPLSTDICRPMTDDTTVYAQECIRYDCDKNTAYVFLYDELDSNLLAVSDQSKAFIDSNEVYSSAYDDSTTPNFKWWGSDGSFAWGYEASFPLSTGSYNFFTQAEFSGLLPDGNPGYFIVSTPPETLQVTCDGVTPAPEFPSAFLPATMIIGVLGAVLLIQRTREH